MSKSNGEKNIDFLRAIYTTEKQKKKRAVKELLTFINRRRFCRLIVFDFVWEAYFAFGAIGFYSFAFFLSFFLYDQKIRRKTTHKLSLSTHTSEGNTHSI